MEPWTFQIRHISVSVRVSSEVSLSPAPSLARVRIRRSRTRSRSRLANGSLFLVAIVSTFSSGVCSQRPLRGYHSSVYQDIPEELEHEHSSGLAFCSDSDDREEQILSAIAGIKHYSDWSDASGETEDYEHYFNQEDDDSNDTTDGEGGSDLNEDESVYTAATNTDGESSFERNLRRKIAERTYRSQRRNTAYRDFTAYKPPPRPAARKKKLHYVKLPDTYRVKDQAGSLSKEDEQNGRDMDKNTEATPSIERPPAETTASARTSAESAQQQQNKQLHTETVAPQKTPTASVSIAPTPNAAVICTPWVRKFLASCHRDVLLPVPKDYCLDNFNLVQLPPIVERIGVQAMTANDSLPTIGNTKSFPIYREALRLIVQEEPLPEHIPEFIQRAARALYLLIHQRYVLSPRGLDMIRRRFLLKGRQHVDPIFGRCPRRTCAGMPLLPFAQTDNIEPLDHAAVDDLSSNMSGVALEYRAQRFCASCGEVFYHWDSKIDGAAWGSSFCHLFLMIFSKDVFGDWKQRRPLHDARVFGFRLHPSVFGASV